MPSGVYDHSNRKKPPPFTAEHRRKIGDASRGEKAHNWKGGVTKNKEYRSWSKNKRNRVLNRGGLGNYTWSDWETLKIQYNNTCPCCHRPEPEIKLSQDHIIPLSKGGSNNIENIQPLCKSCNCKKHTKVIKF